MIREPRPPLAGRPIVINSDHVGAVVGFRYQRLGGGGGGVKGCGLQFKFFGKEM